MKKFNLVFVLKALAILVLGTFLAKVIVSVADIAPFVIAGLILARPVIQKVKQSFMPEKKKHSRLGLLFEPTALAILGVAVFLTWDILMDSLMKTLIYGGVAFVVSLVYPFIPVLFKSLSTARGERTEDAAHTERPFYASTRFGFASKKRDPNYKKDQNE